MLKRIKTSQLQVGMYVHSLDCHWIDHPFFRSSFLIKDAEIIHKLKGAGIRQLVIDSITIPKS